MIVRFSTQKRLVFFYGARLILRSFATFLVKPFFDQVPNKGFALLAAGQFATRLQGVPRLMAADKPCPLLHPSLLVTYIYFLST